MNRLKRWHRRRRFLTAYRILRAEHERHKAAGHDSCFYAINESAISHFCVECPDNQPTPKVD